MPTEIPDDLQRFILVSIPSIPFLEAMLLLRAERQQEWTATQLAGRLYMPEKAAGQLLDELQHAGILATDAPGAFRYAPRTPDLTDLIDRLATVYATNLIDVTHLVHARTAKKALRFADAFKWRKDS
ncbi:hypothetical protein E4K72_12805 [Oxalobacteraceae bacterium OM1]|nr:hypothetical protein E4K72_12805 [Oxalobacteraceae bacterium OM1]